jgi:predicted aspartyl protease
MKPFLIATFLFCTFLSASFTVKPAVADADSEIPFTLEKGHVIVAAKINGDKPVEMVLATGAEHSMINGSVLEKYKLRVYYAADGFITGSSLDRLITFVNVSDIRVGEVKVSGLSMRFGGQATGEIGHRIGREIFGILGADFFKGRIVQFDFQKKVVRFMTRATAATPQPSGAGEVVILPMRQSGERVRLPVTDDVAFNGKKIKTIFDTSALTVVSLTSSAAKQVGLTPPPEKASPLTDKISSLRLGEMEFTDLPVTLHSKGSDFENYATGYGGVVGVAFLQNFLITFDFHGGALILERK